MNDLRSYIFNFVFFFLTGANIQESLSYISFILKITVF